jgi:hypothetical protein
MQYNDLEMLGYKITNGLEELIQLLVANEKIDERACDYSRMIEVIDIVNNFTGFTKEKKNVS